MQRLVRRTSGTSSHSTAFVAGAQRSGTNMVMDMLERSGSTEVYHERDPRAFERYELRSDDVLKTLLKRSPAPLVVFKALCESQDLADLLQRFEPARAVWVYRHYEPVVRSHVRKWRGMPDTMRRLAADENATHGWRGRGMSADTRALIRDCYHDALTNESACALFWYMRNILFFEQGLDCDDRTLLIGYDRLVADPHAGARQLFAFLDLDYKPSVCDFVSAEISSSVPTGDLPIDPRIRAACDDLLARLESVVAAG
ncbi:sulfotransferase family protein [Salinisphaera sp. T31B1]|uniref:sulfotransferase family protein n=1 Tax=Salinisphaera sp. T31B1 TaxID=727963 RepID=UPI0033403E02